jgi:hypothetical protein
MNGEPRSKGLDAIQPRMEGLSPSTYRYRALDAAKHFKSSWIELGQLLYSIHRDKLFRDWGYLTFDAYCAKEVGVRRNTAVKLLKSYAFLEREEPSFLKPEALEERKPDRMPSLDSVNVLRLASENEDYPEDDYEDLREAVLEKASPEEDVKKKVRYVLKTGEKKQTPDEARRASLTKLSSYLESTRRDAPNFNWPNKIVKKLDELLELLGEWKQPSGS